MNATGGAAVAPSIAALDILLDAASIFSVHMVVFVISSLVLFFVLPFFSKRGITLFSLYIAYRLIEERDADKIGYLLQNVKIVAIKNYPRAYDTIYTFLEQHSNIAGLIAFVFPFRKYQKSRITNSFERTFDVLPFFTKKASDIKHFIYSKLDPEMKVHEVFAAGFWPGMSQLFGHATSLVRPCPMSPEKLHSLSTQLVIFVLCYIWQYDTPLPGSTFLYTSPKSPFHYVGILIMRITNSILLTWIGFLITISMVILSIVTFAKPGMFIIQHTLFSLCIIFYIDYLVVETILGTSLFYYKVITSFVHLFLGKEYMPYISTLSKELKREFLNRLTQWCHVACSDVNFRTYLIASLIFLGTGLLKVILDLLVFSVSEWVPSFFSNAKINKIREVHKTNIFICPHCFIREASRCLYVLGFTIFGLFFMVWDNPSQTDNYSCVLLSIPISVALLAIGHWSTLQNGPFSEDPFQLVGLIYTIYLEDAFESENSVSSVSYGGYLPTDPVPLTSPFAELEGETNRMLVLNIPKLVVTFLCDNGLFTGYFSAWATLRPIIRAFSKQSIGFFIDNLAIFQILESFKRNQAAENTYATPTDMPPLSSPKNAFNNYNRVRSQNKRMQSMLERGDFDHLSLVDALGALFGKRIHYTADQFREGYHARHFCRLLMESLIYSALLTSKLIDLPRGSVLASGLCFAKIIWCLFSITIIPRSIAPNDMFDVLLRQSPKNILRRLFIEEQGHYTSSGIVSSLRSAISFAPQSSSMSSGWVSLLRWFSFSQSSASFSMTEFVQDWMLGIPATSYFVFTLAKRWTVLSIGILLKSSLSVRMILVIFAGGTHLMAFKRPWNWMDLYSTLLITCIYWGWRPSIQMASDALYASVYIRRVDTSLTTWMISFISLMLTFTPSHVLAKVIRPSRFAFQMLFLYFLGNGPKCVMNLFAGYFRDPYPIICTGAVIFSISILQVYLYRQLCKRILPNLLGNGIRISYGQGDAQKFVKEQYHRDAGDDQQLIKAGKNGKFYVGSSCPNVHSYWLDQIIEFLGRNNNISMDQVYPEMFVSPSYIDIIDFYFFPDNELKSRIRAKLNR